MSSPALKSLVEFLTRPLLLAGCPVTAVAALQLALQSNLAPFFPSYTSPYPRPPFTFRLSSGLHTPTAIYAAVSVASGMIWEDWISILNSKLGGDVIDIFVSPTAICARVGGPDVPLLMVWKQDEPEIALKDILPISNLKRSSLPASQLLQSVQSRRASNHIRLPSLAATSDSDSDSEYSSSLFSDRDSATTVSTAPPSPSSAVCELPREPRVIFKAPKEVTKYLYQGGSTNVVGGGVMLGAATGKAAPKASSPSVPPPQVAKRHPLQEQTPKRSFGSTNNQWRRRAAPSEGNWRERRV